MCEIISLYIKIKFVHNFLFFRVLDRCPDGIVYIVMCFCCRIVEALGCSAYVTALFAITASVFPDNVSTVFVSENSKERGVVLSILVFHSPKGPA